MEDLRVRGYNAIRNIVVLVNAIAYFFSVHMWLILKLMVNKIYICAKRFFGIPVFYNYAVADSIFELLKKLVVVLFILKGN